MGSQYRRGYVMIRALEGRAGGFARMEYQQGRLMISLQLTRLEAGCPPLRALLLAGDAEHGAVIDLGCAAVTEDGRARLRADVAVDAAALRGCHTLAMAEDWPRAHLVLYGRLHNVAGYPPKQLQESIRRYLAVPPEGAALQQEPGRGAPLFHLRPLQWAREIAELKEYFDALPPSAPFDAPGWRFVRVPLHEGRPEGWCEVGVRVENHAVTEAVYALPGEWSHQPPRGLEGYRWLEGRNGQGYWMLHRLVSVTD